MNNSLENKVENNETRELGHVYYLNLRYVTSDGLEWTKSIPFVKDINRFIKLDAATSFRIPWHFRSQKTEIFIRSELLKTRKFELKNSDFKEWIQGWISPIAVFDNYDQEKLLLHEKKLALDMAFKIQTKKKEIKQASKQS